MPEPIRVQALLLPSHSVPGDYLAMTTYGRRGQGASLGGARASAQAVIDTHLGAYAMLGQDPPQPSLQLQSIDDVASHFARYLLIGTHVVRDETITRQAMGRLPELVIEFYRAERS